MAQLKVFISQKMTGRKREEVINERHLVLDLCRIGYPIPDGIKIIDQYDQPTPENADTMTENELGITLLGRSIEMMHDANIVVICGNPLESKGMMVEMEVIKAYGIPSVTLDELRNDIAFVKDPKATNEAVARYNDFKNKTEECPLTEGNMLDIFNRWIESKQCLSKVSVSFTEGLSAAWILDNCDIGIAFDIEYSVIKKDGNITGYKIFCNGHLIIEISGTTVELLEGTDVLYGPIGFNGAKSLYDMIYIKGGNS